MAQTFSLTRYGRLLLCNALVTGPQDLHEVVLLVDTGSNYTVVPVDALEKVGCSPAASRDHVHITTGSGRLIVPRVRCQTLAVFGCRIDGAELIAHDLPFTGPIDGLLGMDVLVGLRARVDVAAAQIEVP